MRGSFANSGHDEAGQRLTGWATFYRLEADRPSTRRRPLGELFRMRLVWIKPEVVPQLSSQIPGELAGLVTALESS